MTACCGEYHTITLSNDGTLHSFGSNHKGQLGLGYNDYVSLPTPIPNLPQINMISCGGCFTVCVDYEGFIWSFGYNNYGQLGTGNNIHFNVPQKLQDIPPVLSVSCGESHTLMITNDSNLWSFGRNSSGQLCLRDTKARSKPQKTLFSNISKISAGAGHSLFQNNKGEIFACGYNEKGQCGLGHFNSPQITPSLIPNLPSNIVQFVCGFFNSLFLDLEGNVFSVGHYFYGSLGLGCVNRTLNVLNKITLSYHDWNTIMSGFGSCYLIHFEGQSLEFRLHTIMGNLVTGENDHITVPKVINTSNNIQQISCGWLWGPCLC